MATNNKFLTYDGLSYYHNKLQTALENGYGLPLQRGISENSIQQTGSSAGLKGFYWSNIDMTNNTITLSTALKDSDGNIKFGTEQDFDIADGVWGIGDVITIHSSNKYDKCSKITAVSGKTITVDSLPFTAPTSESEHVTDNAVYVVSKPDKGLVDFGQYAVAFGEDCDSVNYNAFSVGRQNQAYGQYSFVAGRQNTANYGSFVAGGRYNNATGTYAYAEGLFNEASGYISHVEGRENVASGECSSAAGGENTVTGYRASVFGSKNQNSAPAAFVAGAGNIAEEGATAAAIFGQDNVVEGNQSLASGRYNKVYGENSIASGEKTIAYKKNSVSLGSGTVANAIGSLALGINCVTGYNVNAQAGPQESDKQDTESGTNDLLGQYSLAFGGACHAKGNYSLAAGNRALSRGTGSIALGNRVVAEKDNQVVVGTFNADESTAQFIVGCGTGSHNNRKNCFSAGVEGNQSYIKIGTSKLTADQVEKLSSLSTEYYEKLINFLDTIE